MNKDTLTRGLYVKYNVTKISDGTTVNNCFVLRPELDPAALEALKAYAQATPNKMLADDLYAWISEIERQEVQHE